MINKDFFLALDELERLKNIKKGVFIEALETALVSAYKKHTGEARNMEVRLNPERNIIRAFAYKTVVDEVVDADKEISLEEARKIKKSIKSGENIIEELNTKDFGRIAVQTAKQVVLQKLREIESQLAYSEISEKEDELINCVVRRIEAGNVYVDMGKLEAVMLPKDQIPSEKYNVNDRIKVYVKRVKEGARGPQILVSRSTPQFVKRLFEIEVPEIAAGIVTIKGVVREAGFRTKIAVYSEDKSVDAIGACVGNRGVRVNSIVNELGGEKIDIIPWNSNALEFIANSLSPAKVIIVEVNDDENTAKVIVPDDKLSLAIGKDGQNARLAARLTGWKIDVKSYTASLKLQEMEKEAEAEMEQTEISEDVFADDDMDGMEDF